MNGIQPYADLVTSEQPSPSGWLARVVAALATCHPERSRRGVMMCLEPQQEKPAESKFCFLKLPIVFGYAVPFAAISKKQNRKGSPTNLIYPLKSKLTSFVTKQVPPAKTHPPCQPTKTPRRPEKKINSHEMHC